MGTVGIYLLYLVISVGLTIVVGTGVARSGRAFLLDVFSGNDNLARAVSRLIVLGFYLLSLGFVTLAMRTGGDVSSAEGRPAAAVGQDRRGPARPGRAAPADAGGTGPRPAARPGEDDPAAVASPRPGARRTAARQ